MSSDVTIDTTGGGGGGGGGGGMNRRWAVVLGVVLSALSLVAALAAVVVEGRGGRGRRNGNASPMQQVLSNRMQYSLHVSLIRTYVYLYVYSNPKTLIFLKNAKNTMWETLCLM